MRSRQFITLPRYGPRAPTDASLTQKSTGFKILATPLLQEAYAIWKHALPLLAAGLAGGMLDEWHHRGMSLWLTLCQSPGIPLMSVLSVQFQLMPAAMLAMSLAAVGSLLRILLAPGDLRPSRRTQWRIGLGQLSCLVAMLLFAAFCAPGLVLAHTANAQLVGMTLLETALSLSAAFFSALLRSALIHGRAAHSAP